MRYIQIHYRRYLFITIGEYVQIQQPAIYKKLNGKKPKIPNKKDVTELILQSDISGADRYIRNIMTEKPKGGRGGLLPGEKEEDL